MDYVIAVLDSFGKSLNTNSGAILALITLVYAIITGRMLSETKKMRQSQTEPHIFISIQPVERAKFLKNMVIQNIGAGPAYDIGFVVEPDIIIMQKRKLSDINLIKRGLKRLAPNEKIEFLVANALEISKEASQIEQRVTVSYRGRKKKDKPCAETFVLDLSEQSGIFSVNTDPFEDIVKKLDAIHQDIQKVTSVFPSRLKVVAYTKDEHDKEIKDMLGKASIKGDEKKEEKKEGSREEIPQEWLLGQDSNLQPSG